LQQREAHHGTPTLRRRAVHAPRRTHRGHPRRPDRTVAEGVQATHSPPAHQGAGELPIVVRTPRGLAHPPTKPTDTPTPQGAAAHGHRRRTRTPPPARNAGRAMLPTPGVR